MVKPLHSDDKNRPAFFVGLRLLFITLISALLFAAVFYGLAALVVGLDKIAASISVLFGMPFLIGAWSIFLFDTEGKYPPSFYFWFPTLVLVIVLITGAIALREGVICLLMLSPLWWISAVGGAFTVKHYRTQYKERSKLSCSFLSLIPLITLFFDAFFPVSTQYKHVSRDIVINAPVTSVWPKLLQVENIAKAEGRWNFTQDVMGIPRPKAALFKGDGAGAVRTSQWEDVVTFEEHITRAAPLIALEWDFVFPNKSLQMHTDEHISPDGKVLKIKNGGYQLTPLNKDQTRLTLYTDYQMTVPLSSYSALWGEIILGDIQNNILNVIKTRAEAGRLSSPDMSATVTN